MEETSKTQTIWIGSFYIIDKLIRNYDKYITKLN